MEFPSYEDSAAFTVTLRFAEAISSSLAALTEAIEVTNGTMSNLQLVGGSASRFTMDITRDSAGPVRIRVKPTRHCGQSHAICTADGKQFLSGLSRWVSTADDARLRALWLTDKNGAGVAVAPKTPPFDPGTSKYEATVDSGRGEVTLHAVPYTSGAEVQVTGPDGSFTASDRWDGGVNAELKVPKSLTGTGWEVTVTSADGHTTRSYLMRVTREVDGLDAEVAEVDLLERPGGHLWRQFDLRLSPAILKSSKNMRDDVFTVTNGTMKKAKRIHKDRRPHPDGGRRVNYSNHWRMSVEPAGADQVTVAMTANRACDQAGALCTDAGVQLANAPTLTLDASTKLTVGFGDDVTAMETAGKLEFEVTLSRASPDWVYVDFATKATGTAEAGSDFVFATRELRFAPGRTTVNAEVAILDVSVGDDGETVEVGLWNAALVDRSNPAEAGKEKWPLDITDDTATWTFQMGTQQTESDPPSVALQDRPASHDGASAFPLRLAFSEDMDISAAAMRDHALTVSGGTVTAAQPVDGSTALWEITITPSASGDVRILVPAARPCAEPGALCTADDRALAVGLALLIPYAPVILPPLTAAFSAVPEAHDGSSRFTVGLAFSEAVKPGIQKVEAALTVTGGTVKKARRVAPPSNEQWTITIKPDGHGAVSVRLPATSDCDATGAICTADGRKLSGGVAVRIAGPPGLSVADAQVQEGPNAKLEFAVTLDRAASGTVTVGYMTANGTATAGEDYTAASGMLTFAAGETAKTVTVAVLDDSHDEGSETLTLVLMNASGAYLAGGEATGTINNSDPMPKAWMVRLGRTVGSQAVDALTQRLDGAASSHITVAGINIIGAPGVAPELEDDDPFALPEWAKTGALEPEARTITGEDLVLRSAFHLSGGAANGEGTAFTAWGRVATGGFEAQVDDVTMDGNVTTGLVGFDAEWERALAGVMLSHSEGEGSYRLDPSQGDDAGTVDSSLTGVYPYARMDLNERVSAWALAGVGSGELTLHREGHQSMRTDLSMRMGALGVKGQVLDGGRDGLSVNVKSDAMWVGMENERTSDMVGTQGDVTRLRLIVEGERAYAVGEGATFTPSAEIGVRHDGADAETGTGVEVGAGLRTPRARSLSKAGYARSLRTRPGATRSGGRAVPSA